MIFRSYFGKYLFVVLLVTFFSNAPVTLASETVYAPGDTITVGEFVYNDDFTANTSDCTISIYSPNGTTLVNEVVMTADANGWHHYDYVAPVTNGKYASFMSCGTALAGDLVKVDKTFIVKTATLTDSSIATSVWANGDRTLTAFGSLAADVWNDTYASVRRLTDKTLTGGGSLATESYIDTAKNTIVTEIETNRTLINALNNITAADVWGYGTRSINSGTVELSTASKQGIWDVATSGLTTSGTIGKKIVDNLDVEVSSRGTSNLTAADVWASATRTLTDYSTSSIATAVWANATRTLTNYGNDITAADVWNVLSDSLVAVGSIGAQIATNLDGTISSITGWSVRMSNLERIQAGYVYRTKVYILNSSATPTAPASVPTVTVYDANRNAVVSAVPMTLVSTGVYEYTYTVASGASQGLWETVASTEVESGKTIQTNDYWEVSGSPAQVLINSVTASSISSVLGNVTITNEGLSGYEYDYEWCVVTDLDNECGGNDDAYYASAAKFINPSEDWNTNLTASVASIGTYYFKLVVYFGTDSSGASRVFTVTEVSEEQAGGGGGGSGGGGGASGSSDDADTSECNGADFNSSGLVDSVDFSILLFFWKQSPTFSNPCVDVNLDQKVDSIDFSIMLYQWGTKPK
ncbi:hypothetical protein IPF86_00565 [Candidatus Nomurabacteria bacterium]|nr:MAG: hypothetical protein IPF86_00565 [Candidatus Nomurabacteria bacterium]